MSITRSSIPKLSKDYQKTRLQVLFWTNRFFNYNQVMAPLIKKNLLSNIFNTVYPSDEPIHQSLSADQKKKVKAYNKLPIVQLTSFLGLPNAMRKDISSEPTSRKILKDIFKNFIGLPADDDFKWRYIPRIPFAFTYHLAKMLLVTPWNILKAVTELPLTALREFCFYQAAKAKTNTGKRIGLVAYSIAGSLLFFVRAATSPGKNAKAAAQFGFDFFPNSRKGKVLGWSLGVFSALTSIAIYTIALPLGIKALTINVLPHAPSWLMQAGSWVSNHLNHFGQMMQPVSQVLGQAGISVSSSMLGLSVASGIAFVVKNLWSFSIDRIFSGKKNASPITPAVGYTPPFETDFLFPVKMPPAKAVNEVDHKTKFCSTASTVSTLQEGTKKLDEVIDNLECYKPGSAWKRRLTIETRPGQEITKTPTTSRWAKPVVAKPKLEIEPVAKKLELEDIEKLSFEELFARADQQQPVTKFKAGTFFRSKNDPINESIIKPEEDLISTQKLDQ